MKCFFSSDLHGYPHRYRSLFKAIESERPQAVFLGGDLLPNAFLALASRNHADRDFINGFLVSELKKLKKKLGGDYPRIFVILGNDDPRSEEKSVLDAEHQGLWTYIHNRKTFLESHAIYGYSCIPPSPFQLNDWERYDVSRHVDPGCIPLEEGFLSVPIPEHDLKFMTIKEDLDLLTGEEDLSNAIFLFHAPPYRTNLDRAALDDKFVDHVQLDPHIGSIAIQRLITARQPRVTLHGHVHESTRITGKWRDRIGKTHAFSAAHDGPELALVIFDTADPEKAVRQLL